MQLSILLLVLVIFISAFSYMSYHHEVERRAQEKKRQLDYGLIERMG